MTNPNDFGLPRGTGAGVEGMAGIGALLPMAGGIYDTYQRSRDVKTQIKARKEEAELAYQRQVAMWHMQNAYNTPEQQMARFGAAGLNPHLIYGQGSAGLAGSPPAYQPPDIQTQGLWPAYGSAVASVLPTLMSVGTWMQNMRLSENKINQTDQLVEFLKAKYPHEIRKFDQVEALMPYQKDVAESRMFKSRAEVAAWLEEFRHRYGIELDVGAPYEVRGERGLGMRELERMLRAEQGRKTGLEADWLSPTRVFGLVNGLLGRMFGKSGSRLVPRGGGAAPRTGVAKRVKTFYEKGKRKSQVVDY